MSADTQSGLGQRLSTFKSSAATAAEADLSIIAGNVDKVDIVYLSWDNGLRHCSQANYWGSNRLMLFCLLTGLGWTRMGWDSNGVVAVVAVWMMS